MTHKEQVARYRLFVELRTKGAKNSEIAAMFGVTPQLISWRIRQGVPKLYKPVRGILAKNGFGHLEGRERARMMVRIRDKFTCQDCGARRLPITTRRTNSSKTNLKGRLKLFDIHHTDGRCGKNSRGYDSTKDLSGLITLCHKCHYNRPEHTDRKKHGPVKAA